ncbi:hypothetical protein PCYB_084440 [Plasmodium cynomolgi strain B]|uniref:Uncharacterized protein n=1 Tax=Plasmodium cynomolgi (strain B) TaxID=1120755 RepID=K6UJV8_PLACD|nr:hypothetical protein PCYB_084440 [Plasmodium cynomolgi strain B]GAB66283.1 hypothetical protein PCYB_084440 [Plasmodium cynomolgi strain B]
MNHRKVCGWGSAVKRRRCTKWGISLEGRKEEEEGAPWEGGPNQNGQYHINLCNSPPIQDTLFTLTCLCICLLCNTNCYNHYYRLMSLLRERRSFHLHERVNHFVNELAKQDAKCQHIWNMKNALLYLYVEMCLKMGHSVVKKRRRKKDGKNLSRRMGFSTYRKEMSTQGLPSKGEPSCIQRKNKKNVHASSNEKILKYVKDDFRFFENIMEIQSYNYMATSHICTFYQLIVFLCSRKKKSRCESTSICKTIENQFYRVVKKNAYYYAMHNSFLLVHLQDVYLSLVEWLRGSYYVVVRTNLFTYSFDLVRGHELCRRGKKKKNYEQVRKITPQMLYKKLKRRIKKYKVHSRQMIHLLDKIYSEQIYIHFYSNGLRNVLYCRCNCNFFFLEMVCNVILPLQLKRHTGGKKNDSPIGRSDEWKGASCVQNKQTEKKTHTQEETSQLLRSVDRYLAKELEYLLHEYTRFRVKYSEEKKSNLTKRVSRLLKRCAHIRNTWYYHSRASTKGDIKTKRKGWIANGLLTVGQHGEDDPTSHPRKEKTQQTGEATCPPVLVSYYGIFFKCIIYTIHEYALQICGVLRGGEDHKGSASRRCRQVPSSFVDSEYLQHLKCPHHLLPPFEGTKQSGEAIPPDTLNCSDNLHTLRKIYLDILHFFKATKMRDWKKRSTPFGHVTSRQSETQPRRGSNEMPFLKFLFSANFYLFLCEHRYAFYLLREVLRALHFIFPRVMRRGRPLWKGPG